MSRDETYAIVVICILCTAVVFAQAFADPPMGTVIIGVCALAGACVCSGAVFFMKRNGMLEPDEDELGID